MKRSFPTAVGIPVFVAVVALLASGGTASGMPRTDKLWVKATDSRNRGRCDEAEATSRKLRKEHPGSGAAALFHARDLACLGKRDEALVALEDAARLGYDDPTALRGQPEFRSIETESRFQGVLESVTANRAKAVASFAAARAVPAPETAPSAPTLAKLEKLLDEADREGDGPDDPLPPMRSWAERLRGTARRVAGYERYAKEHPGAADLESARWAEIESRLRLAGGWSSAAASAADGLASALDAFVARFPKSERAAEAGYLHTWLRVAPRIPDDFDGERDAEPGPRCDGMLEELRGKAAGDPSDPWVRRYDGLLAVCLDAGSEKDGGRLRAAADAYLGKDPVSGLSSDLYLRSQVLGIKFRLDGLPDFEASTLAGDPVSLKGLRGKVALLVFWSPG